MIPPELLLVIPVKLVERMPLPPLPSHPRRGRPRYYSERLFLKALIMRIVRHLHKVHELLTVLDEPTAEMQALRALLTEGGRYPTRRTWERRLKAVPAGLPTEIGCLGRYLVELIQPWCSHGRAVAIDRRFYAPMAVSGTRRTVPKAKCRILLSTPKPTGPSPVGTAGALAGSCTS